MIKVYIQFLINVAQFSLFKERIAWEGNKNSAANLCV
jgi:hypothetical protein